MAPRRTGGEGSTSIRAEARRGPPRCPQGLLHVLYGAEDDGRVVFAVYKEERTQGNAAGPLLAAQHPALAAVARPTLALNLLVMQVLVGSRVEVYDDLAV